MNGKAVFIAAIFVAVLVIPAFGGGGEASIMAVDLDRLEPGVVLDSTTLVEIAAHSGEIDDELIPIRGILVSDEKMCLIVYDPAQIIFDDTLVSLESETSSDDFSFVSASDYPNGTPVFDLAIVESDGTVRRFKKDALVDEYVELKEGTTLMAFVSMDSRDGNKGVTICQGHRPNEQYVKFESDEERANNRSLIAFLSV